MIIRSLFDSLVDRLNEYRYELTIRRSIPLDSQILVNNCLDEFKNVIIPYVQRTCCQNDVKQEDVKRLEIFSDKMQTVVRDIQCYSDKKQIKSTRNSEVGKVLHIKIVNDSFFRKKKVQRQINVLGQGVSDS
jgi:hypothetical protein